MRQFPGDDQQIVGRIREELSGMLTHLDKLINGRELDPACSTEASALREKVFRMLQGVNTDLKELADIEKADIYRDNPAFSGKRRNLISSIEGIKISFEYEVKPAFERLTAHGAKLADSSPSMFGGPVTKDSLDTKKRAYSAFETSPNIVGEDANWYGPDEWRAAGVADQKISSSGVSVARTLLDELQQRKLLNLIKYVITYIEAAERLGGCSAIHVEISKEILNPKRLDSYEYPMIVQKIENWVRKVSTLQSVLEERMYNRICVQEDSDSPELFSKFFSEFLGEFDDDIKKFDSALSGAVKLIENARQWAQGTRKAGFLQLNSDIEGMRGAAERIANRCKEKTEKSLEDLAGVIHEIFATASQMRQPKEFEKDEKLEGRSPKSVATALREGALRDAKAEQSRGE